MRSATATARRAPARGRRDRVPRYLDDGGWVPIEWRIVAALPRGRPYSEAEAMLSFSVDMALGTRRPLREYSRLWHWGRNRVRDFMRNHVHGNHVQPDPGPENFMYV